MTTDMQRELAASMSSLSGYPVESRTVQAFVAVAQDYADALIADAEKRAAARALRDAAAAPLPVGHLNVRSWLRARADALDPS